ncbi:MAG: ABC transporter permease [Segetibacter sp.]
MLKNYFKIAIRNLWKNKVYSFITISGLSLGMAGAILLLLWIQNALSIDQFHKKSDYLYKIYTKATIDGYVECLETTPAPLASVLKQDYSEIIQTTRVSGTGKLLSTSEKKIMARGNYTDSAFLNMFSFPLIQGNVRKSLN